VRRSPCVSYFKPYLSSVLRTYMPCLPTRAMKAPSGEQWVHEVKHDGYRLQARKVDGRVRLYTKQGYDWSKKYPLIPEALCRLRATSVVLDGEAMCFTDGIEAFEQARGRYAGS
jgi:bifunctional non-homologous end joining protein LigD